MRFSTAFLLGSFLLLAGCAPFSMQMTSRADGSVFKGTATKVGSGEARLSVVLDGVQYEGRLEAVSAKTYQAFANQHGRSLRTSTADQAYIAHLASVRGDSLICSFATNPQAQADQGVCMDADRKVYDVTIRSTIERSRSRLLGQLD